MNKRFIAFLILGLAVIGVAEWDLRERSLEPLRKLDRFWVDFCLGNAGKKIGDPAITMVRITEDYEPVSIGGNSENDGGKELTRLDYAAFLYAIAKLNPQSVSFMPTPVFENKSVLNETSIYPLKDAALQLPRMTLGAVVSSKEDGKKIDYPALTVNGDASEIPAFASTTQAPDPELLGNGDPAFTSGDSFNSVEGNEPPRVQLIAKQGDKIVPGFILMSVAKSAGIPLTDITVELDSAPTIMMGEQFAIPIAGDGTMAIPSHAGLSHAMFDLLSPNEDGKQKKKYHFASLKVEDVALAAERNDSVAKTIYDEFQGKFESLSENLILVGFDKTSERTISTAAGEWLSPMTATARAIATIQSGRHTVRWPMWGRIVAYVAVIALGLILLSMKRMRFLGVIGGVVVTLIALVLIFHQTLSWSPPFGIFGLLALLLFTSLGGGKKRTVVEEEQTGEEAEPVAAG